MSDRPDWLPEPEKPPSRPIGERLRLEAASILSLFVLATGLVALMVAMTQLGQLATGGNKLAPRIVSALTLFGGLCLVVAYLWRWSLHYARIGLAKDHARDDRRH